MTEQDRITDAVLSALLAGIAEAAGPDRAEFHRRWEKLEQIAPRTAHAIGSLVKAEGENVIAIMLRQQG